MAFDFDSADNAPDEPAYKGRSRVSELLSMRAQIDAQLPATELGDLNLDKELVRQYLVTQALQAEVVGDMDIPANQKAMVLNSCAGILDKLQATQQKFYKAERMKKIETILIRCLRKLPVETVEEFMDEYSRTLEEET